MTDPKPIAAMIAELRAAKCGDGPCNDLGCSLATPSHDAALVMCDFADDAGTLIERWLRVHRSENYECPCEMCELGPGMVRRYRGKK